MTAHRRLIGNREFHRALALAEAAGIGRDDIGAVDIRIDGVTFYRKDSTPSASAYDAWVRKDRGRYAKAE